MDILVEWGIASLENVTMEFGFSLPTNGPLATPDNLVAIARHGEDMGFGVARLGDHIVIPRHIASRHPSSPVPGFPGAESGDWLDSLTVLTFLAGQTSSIKLAASVIVLPLRPPVLTAKILATLDVLSGGRLIVGCGVGWMREEFEALQTPPFDERGAVSDEYILAFKELWTSDNPTFDGRYCRFSDIAFLPKPVQRPHPPIWVGGNSPAAMRRAARLGDAWYPTAGNPEFPLDTPEMLSRAQSRLHRYAEQAGRDPAELELVHNVSRHNDREAELEDDGRRRAMTGTAEQVAEDINAIGELGVRRIMFNFLAATLSETLDGMERFATRIMPAVEG